MAYATDRQGVATQVATALTALIPSIVWYDAAPGRIDNSIPLPVAVMEVGNGTLTQSKTGGGGYWNTITSQGDLYTIHLLTALPSETGSTTPGAIKALQATIRQVKESLIVAQLLTGTLTTQIERILSIQDRYDGPHNIIQYEQATFVGCHLDVLIVALDYLPTGN